MKSVKKYKTFLLGFVLCAFSLGCSQPSSPSITGVVEVSQTTVSGTMCTLLFNVLDFNGLQTNLVDLSYVRSDASGNTKTGQVFGNDLVTVFATSLLPANGTVSGSLMVSIEGLTTPVRVNFVINGVTSSGIRQFVGQSDCEGT